MAEPDPVDAHVGRRLGEARTAAKMSRAALSRDVGVSAEQLRKYELAIDRVSAGRLLALATALKRPVDWFYDGALADTKVAEDAEPYDASAGDPHMMTRRLLSAFRTLSADTQNEVLSQIETRSAGD
ncbi:MAG: helix-turn-helix transcriptional regulator [Pacificimonas sp.]